MPKDWSQHIIVAGRDGKNRKPERPSDELCRAEYEIRIRNLLRELDEQEGNKKILIFVHGGLNSYKDSIARAEELCPKINDAGYFPVFVCWRSALWPCYWEHLTSIRQGRVHRGYEWFTWLYYLTADVGRAVFRVPAALYLQVINDCKPYMPNHNPEGQCAGALLLALKERVRTKPPAKSIKIYEGTDWMTYQEKRNLLIRLVATYPLKIVSGALIDAVGKSAWDNMLRRTKTLFRNPDEFDIRDHYTNPAKVDAALNRTSSGALSIFFARLSKHIQRNNNSTYKITLIGHSMGTIVLNTVLHEYPRLPCEDIVYMAAACSIQDFIASVVPFLKKHVNTKFYNLCLHPLAEQTEASAYEVAPRGSLLTWIDNFLASPQTIPDRTLGCWENVLQTTHMIPRALRGRIHIKAFDAGASDGKPRRHGDFGAIEFWDKKQWTPICEDCVNDYYRVLEDWGCHGLPIAELEKIRGSPNLLDFDYGPLGGDTYREQINVIKERARRESLDLAMLDKRLREVVDQLIKLCNGQHGA
jgi:hypothetical protein